MKICLPRHPRSMNEAASASIPSTGGRPFELIQGLGSDFPPLDSSTDINLRKVVHLSSTAATTVRRCTIPGVGEAVKFPLVLLTVGNDGFTVGCFSLEHILYRFCEREAKAFAKSSTWDLVSSLHYVIPYSFGAVASCPW
ncbi:hypothetical protein OROMI_028029 [Orobanche minor]